MKNLLLLITIVSFFISCTSEPKPIADKPIEYIKIESNRSVDSIFQVKMQLSDGKMIKHICQAINNGKKELRKFQAQYYLTVHYKDGGEQMFLCNNNYVKTNGSTYILERKFYDFVDDVMPTSTFTKGPFKY